MKFNKKKPCKNCPFVPDTKEAKDQGFVPIRFACRERAEEIEESAYRNGFPCHQSADYHEAEDEEFSDNDGYYAGEHTSHCAGALLMYASSGGNCDVQSLDDPDAVLDKLDYDAPHYDSETYFLDSYGPPESEDDDAT